MNTEMRDWSACETRYLISIWEEEPVQRELDYCYHNWAVYRNIDKCIAVDLIAEMMQQ